MAEAGQAEENSGELLSIGALARACGLSISSLRFYDREGLLRPAEVSAHSGYRWYAAAQIDDARLLAALRHLGLPLAAMAAVLARREEAAAILEEHLRALDEGLADARVQARLIRERWGSDGADPAAPTDAGPALAAPEPTTVRPSAAALAAGLRMVRHAVGDDPDMPAIHGVQLVAITHALRLAATDRVRAAFAEVPGPAAGRHFRTLLPTPLADELLARLERLSGQEEVLVSWSRPRLSISADAGMRLAAELPDAAFPDLSHAIPKARNSAELDAATLAGILAAAPGERTWWLAPDGGLTPSGAEVPPGAAWVNRDYLTDALAALRGDGAGRRLRLDFDGPARPLALRRAEEPGSFVVLLPITPEE